MHKKRIDRLLELAGDQGLGALALMPGPNLLYLTGGLSFTGLSERPKVALFPVNGSAAIILPAFETDEVEKAAVAMDLFPYRDEDGHDGAFESACATLGLAGRTIGVEALQMRLLEGWLLERHAIGCQLVAAEELLAELRMRKDPSELELMRSAIGKTETALHATMSQVKAGLTERQVAVLLGDEMVKAGAERVGFIMVAAGPNAASPHAAFSDRPIERGDTILVDCGLVMGGYNSDITRTFSVGPLDPELAQVYEVVKAANEAGRAAVRPGALAEEVDRAARAVIEEVGYGDFFTHRTGHGLGLQGHEPPYIVRGNRRPLEPGMTFTIEPGIYLPGRGGVRIEDDVLVTQDGCISLTTFPRDLNPL